MKLKPTYYDNGQVRPYYEDENGKEYLYYRDKKRGLIIRDFTEEDALPWYNNMYKPNCTPAQKKAWVENFRKIVRHRDDQNPFFDLVVTNLSGKIVGGVEVYQVKDDEINVQAEIVLRMKDEFWIGHKGESLIEALINLQQEYGWFSEKLILRGEDEDQRIELGNKK